MTALFGGIEAGGTKFLCGIGTGPEDLEVISIPTLSPDETVPRLLRFFHERAGSRLGALGIASFGPLDLDPTSKTYGHLTTTPKSAWRNYNLLGAMKRIGTLPIGLDTDVNAAVRAEARWGSATDVADCVYLTIGTGIGGGALVGGRVIRGLMHPEMGHMRVPHDRQEDPFAGCCPFHGDCLEGLASGPALFRRWGTSAEDLPVDHPAWRLEARYLALALSTLVCILSPQRLILGGGLMQREMLFPMIRREVGDLLNSYIAKPQLSEEIDRYIVPAQLGHHAGLLGAILLAEEAWLTRENRPEDGR